VVVDSTTVADNEYAYFTANGLESKSVAELQADVGYDPVAVNFIWGANAGSNITNGYSNFIYGYYAGNALTTGDHNCYIGTQAGRYGTNSNDQIAIGQYALHDSYAYNNIGLGAFAGYETSSGFQNTAIGSYSLYNNTSGDYNVAIGNNAIRTMTNRDYNTAIGYRAGYGSTGNNNTFIGQNAGTSMTGGWYNVILGSFNGYNSTYGLTIRSDNNNIVLSEGSGIPRQLYTPNNNTTPNSYYVINYYDTYGVEIRTFNSTDGGMHNVFYNENGIVGSISTNGTTTTFATSSDYRLKENVIYNFDATSRLKELKPSRFNFKTDPNKTVDGFLAHEVQDIVPEAVIGKKDEEDEKGNPQYQSIDHSLLVPLLVKTIQELEARITILEGV
jgi:hypothetical protein